MSEIDKTLTRAHRSIFDAADALMAQGILPSPTRVRDYNVKNGKPGGSYSTIGKALNEWAESRSGRREQDQTLEGVPPERVQLLREFHRAVVADVKAESDAALAQEKERLDAETQKALLVAQEAVEQARREAHDARTRLGETRARVEQLEAAEREARAAMQTLNEDLAAERAAARAGAEQTARIERELREARHAEQTAIAELQSTVAREGARYEALEQRLSEQHSAYEQLQERLKSLQADASQYAAERDWAQAELVSAQAQLADQKALVDTSHAEARDLVRANATLQTRLDDAQQVRECLEEQLATALATEASQADEIKRMSQRVQALEKGKQRARRARRDDAS